MQINASAGNLGGYASGVTSAETPNREQALTQLLEQHLASQLQQIREQVNAPSGNGDTEGVGKVVDVRA